MSDINDYDVAMKAITKDKKSLCYLSDELRNNYAIALTAVTLDKDELVHVGDELKNNLNIIIASLDINSYSRLRDLKENIAFKNAEDANFFIKYLIDELRKKIYDNMSEEEKQKEQSRQYKKAYITFNY